MGGFSPPSRGPLTPSSVKHESRAQVFSHFPSPCSAEQLQAVYMGTHGGIFSGLPKKQPPAWKTSIGSEMQTPFAGDALWQHQKVPKGKGQGFGTGWSLRSLPTQGILWICDSRLCWDFVAFKARLDVALGSPVWWLATLHIAGGWNWMIIVVLFNTGHSRISHQDCCSRSFSATVFCLSIPLFTEKEVESVKSLFLEVNMWRSGRRS